MGSMEFFESSWPVQNPMARERGARDAPKDPWSSFTTPTIEPEATAKDPWGSFHSQYSSDSGGEFVVEGRQGHSAAQELRSSSDSGGDLDGDASSASSSPRQGPEQSPSRGHSNWDAPTQQAQRVASDPWALDSLPPVTSFTTAPTASGPPCNTIFYATGQAQMQHHGRAQVRRRGARQIHGRGRPPVQGPPRRPTTRGARPAH